MIQRFFFLTLLFTAATAFVIAQNNEPVYKLDAKGCQQGSRETHYQKKKFP